MLFRSTAFERFLPPGDDGPWWSFVEPAEREQLVEEVGALAVGPDRVLQREVRGVDVHGDPVVVRVFVAPIADTTGTGGARHLSVQVSDITSADSANFR